MGQFLLGPECNNNIDVIIGQFLLGPERIIANDMIMGQPFLDQIVRKTLA